MCDRSKGRIFHTLAEPAIQFKIITAPTRYFSFNKYRSGDLFAISIVLITLQVVLLTQIITIHFFVALLHKN